MVSVQHRLTPGATVPGPLLGSTKPNAPAPRVRAAGRSSGVLGAAAACAAADTPLRSRHSTSHSGTGSTVVTATRPTRYPGAADDDRNQVLSVHRCDLIGRGEPSEAMTIRSDRLGQMHAICTSSPPNTP